jgi:RimJ/RimL family protein N-acetyltransferase
VDRSDFIENIELSLVKYSHDDDRGMYECWLDIDTQKGYNGVFDESFEKFQKEYISRFHFYSSIIEKKSKKIIGAVRLSPPEYEPDLAIWIFKSYRNKGYGYKAFSLGLRYCFNKLKLEKVGAGCYENNVASMRMLEKIGFVRDCLGDICEIDVFDKFQIKQLNYVLTKDIFIKTNR